MEAITMIWTDMIVEKLITDLQLREILHELLKIPIEEIQVVKAYDDFPIANTMSIVCQKSLFHSGFTMMLSLYLFGEVLNNTPEIDKFASAFSIQTNCKCLLPSENENQNHMVLYNGLEKEIVYLDEDLLEHEGIYELKKKV